MRKNKLLFTVNANNNGKVFYNKFRWDKIDPIKRNFIIFNQKKSENLLLNKYDKKEIKNYKLSDAFIYNEYKIKFLNLNKYKPNFKKFKKIKFQALRDKNFMKWRYQNHPYFKYQIIFEGSYEEPSICVFRKEKYFGKYNGEIARVVDFFYPSNKKGKKNAKKLLKNLFNYLMKKKYVFVDYYNNIGDFSKIFNSFSISKKNQYRNLFVSKYCPIKYSNFEQNLYFTVPKKEKINLKEFYIGKSDIDGDVPAKLN